MGSGIKDEIGRNGEFEEVKGGAVSPGVEGGGREGARRERVGREPIQKGGDCVSRSDQGSRRENDERACRKKRCRARRAEGRHS